MVIFDLDQTLVDSNSVLHFRDSGDWKSVVRNIKSVKPFEGINEILTYLNNKKVKIVIVSSSPKFYIEKIVELYNWKISLIIGYHDTVRKKPHPDPFILALTKLNIDASLAISVGDRDIDIICSKNANVFSIGCTWGISNSSQLLSANPNLLLSNLYVFKTNWTFID